MNFSTLEVLLLSFQILLIPFGKFLINQQKKEIISDVEKIITEHYLSLESLIDHNKDNLDKLNSNLIHKSEIGKIKLEILHARIKDIETYLGKTNGFQARSINQIDDNNSGIFN